ncbi:MAG: SIMPL domain-containing protein [Erythrobacter sp.]
MIRFAIPTLAAAAMASSVQAAEVQIQSPGPVVELTVSEIVHRAPDVAQIGAGVMSRATTAQEAVRMNAAAMDRVIARLRALGIDRRDIQTANFNLNPSFNYDRESGEQTFTGYTVNNQVNVKLRDLERAGEVLDALVATGANNIYGPNFSLEDDAAAKAEARASAFKSGRTMAEGYARMAGYNSVRLLEVSESFRSFGPRPEAMMRMESAAAGDAKTPIEPGEVGTGVTITVKYEMTR